MAAQGFQPQNGSGCGNYQEWANSDQYSPEEYWDNFAYMQENSTTNFQYDENHPDDETYWQDELDGQTLATEHTLGTQLGQGENSMLKWHHPLMVQCHGSYSAKWYKIGWRLRW